MAIVVNCFQIVSLTLEPQRIWMQHFNYPRCELLSDCIFDIGTTTKNLEKTKKNWLWIAFRLYLWHWNHNPSELIFQYLCVVNCFQIVSLTLEPQHIIRHHGLNSCCELLSDCIFDIGTTTIIFTRPHWSQLWIAFRLYLWHWNHNFDPFILNTRRVVNCFQIVSLTLEPQLGEKGQFATYCCELLSDCIFDIGTTTRMRQRRASQSLWIAFRLYLWHWNHNEVFNPPELP